ncbi:hypothetical protein DITRI_Ditri20bG0059700 [Diplodiscus trichospermus]
MKKEEGKEEPITYDDFEPYCEWKHEANSCYKEADVLEIHLQRHGFKKEELKLENQRDGFVHISGEHPMRKNMIKRFKKKIDVSNYETKEIETTFEDGIIRLKLPNKSGIISFIRGGVFLRSDYQALKKIAFFLLLLPLAFSMYKCFECTHY